MNGFFSRLAQRTLGTGQVIRPSIAPRFAPNPTTTNSVVAADPIEDHDQQSSEISNTIEKPKWQEPFIDHVPVNNVDSPHLQEQQIQTGSEQAEHMVDIQPERYENQAERTEQVVNIIKPGTIETKTHFDRIKPAEDTYNDIETPKIPDIGTPKIPVTTETRTVSSDPINLPSQTDLGHYQSTRRGLKVADALLVPMPGNRTQSEKNSSAHFEDLDYPIDLHRVSGNEEPNSADTRKLQGSNESQTINVTIGRIEVRAVHPPPAPIKQSRVKTNPALSLDDYLQQRRKGER